MAFVPGYSSDVFVSYAHVDDEPLGPEVEHGWVTTFVDALRTSLNKKLGKRDACRIWQDHGLQVGENVTPQLMEAVRGAATFVLIWTRGFQESAWCAREKDAFLRHLPMGAQPGRVFLVEAAQIERNERPPELRDLKESRLWAPEEHGRPSHTLCEAGLIKGHAEYDQFFTELLALAARLEAVLRALKAGGEPGGRPIPTTSPVLLAEPTDDLETERKSLIQYLDQCGVPALPDGLYPREDPGAFQKAMEKHLPSCKLFIQLLSGIPGREVPGRDYGFPRFQFDIAKRAGKDILQWHAQSVVVDAVTDPDHKRLLREATVRVEGFEDFKREVKRRLSEEPNQGRARKSGGRQIPAFVFVDHEKDDEDLAGDIGKTLQQLGAAVSFPALEDSRDPDPKKAREDLEETLRDCYGLIVVYGNTTANWARSQLREYLKVLAHRPSPVRALAVFLGPPKETKQRLNMLVPNLREIDCTAGREETAARLREFVGQLRP